MLKGKKLHINWQYYYCCFLFFFHNHSRFGSEPQISPYLCRKTSTLAQAGRPVNSMKALKDYGISVNK